MNVIKENPDYINLERGKLKSTDKTARSFGYYNGQIQVGKPGELHLTMVIKNRVSLTDIKYSGRIWLKDKIISFWDYPPDKNKLKSVVHDLERELNIKIWSDPKYKIELAIDKKGKPIRSSGYNWTQGKNQSLLIPLQDYTGGAGVDLGGDPAKRHILSPVAKSGSVPFDVGSKKNPSGKRAGETMAQYHYRTRQESVLREGIKRLIGEQLDEIKFSIALLEIDDIAQAISLARDVHSGQWRKSSPLPYMVHPMRVYQRAKNRGLSKKHQVLAILHDTVEDSSNPTKTLNKIKDVFGNKIAKLISYLSHDKAIKYDDYLMKLAKASKTAFEVKIIDIFDNMKDYPNPKQLEKYKNSLKYLLNKGIKINNKLKNEKEFILGENIYKD